MEIKELQEKYKLPKEEHDKIYLEIKNKIIGDCLPTERVCNIILGQNGSGKSTYSKILQKNDSSLVTLNGDYIRSFHPAAAYLMNEYPKDYCYIILDDWRMWKERLLKDLIKEGYSFNFEATMKNPKVLESLVNILRQNNYKLNIYIIALNYIESRLRVLERFFMSVYQTGLGRIIDSNYQRTSFDNLTTCIDKFNWPELQNLVILDYNFIPYPVAIESNQKSMFLKIIRDMYSPKVKEDFVKRYGAIHELYEIYGPQQEENIKKRLEEQMSELKNYLYTEKVGTTHVYQKKTDTKND